MSLQDLSPRIKCMHGTTWKRMSHAVARCPRGSRASSRILGKTPHGRCQFNDKWLCTFKRTCRERSPFSSSTEVAALSALSASSLPPLSDCSFSKSEINNTFLYLLIYLFIYPLLLLHGAICKGSLSCGSTFLLPLT